MTNKKKIKISTITNSLGPGVISGAADDDPSGIATYSIAGAQFGTSLLWTALLTWPLMAAVQMMCARIGLVTGQGLAANLRHTLPRPFLIAICVALFIANTFNVGADLSAMADAAEMLTNISSHIWVLIFAVLISWATIKLKYNQISRILKWLALFLFCYIFVALIAKPDWSTVLHDTFLPSWPKSFVEWSTLVAILGTTISPYLFFWQSSQEVEEEIAMGRKDLKSRKGATKSEIKIRKIDVGIGTFFSNIVMFFIILATSLTLFKNGIHNIESSKQAALALQPLAGSFASLLYTIGILGLGFLAIPTLTASAAYALAETYDWSKGLDESLSQAKTFYSVIISSTIIAVIFDFADFNPLSALYYSAIVNGVLAPFLLTAILFVAINPKLMHGQPSSKLSLFTVGLTIFLMFASAIAMFMF